MTSSRQKDNKKGQRGSSGKPKASGRPSSTRTVRSRGASARGKKKSSRITEKELPLWLHWTLTGFFSALMVYLAFIVFIRPYSYRWKPCYGNKGYGICLPSGYEVFGIDVSHHQGRIDWDRVANQTDCDRPLKFVMIKSTEGATFKDDNYAANIEGARRVGLVCGSYLFFNPASDPAAQAAFFIRNSSVQKGDFPPVVDVERHGESADKLRHDLRICLDSLERHYGVRPLIYTSYKFRQRYLDTPEFDGYTIWIARYYTDSPGENADWKIWQFTDRGRVGGIGEYTDLNVFNGTESEMGPLLVR